MSPTLEVGSERTVSAGWMMPMQKEAWGSFGDSVVRSRGWMEISGRLSMVKVRLRGVVQGT